MSEEPSQWASARGRSGGRAAVPAGAGSRRRGPRPRARRPAPVARTVRVLPAAAGERAAVAVLAVSGLWAHDVGGGSRRASRPRPRSRTAPRRCDTWHRRRHARAGSPSSVAYVFAAMWLDAVSPDASAVAPRLMRRSIAWTWLGLVGPVRQPVFPKQVVDDVWRVAASQPGRSPVRATGGWWFWGSRRPSDVRAHLAGPVASGTGSPGPAFAPGWRVFARAVLTVAFVLWVRVVRGVSAAHDAGPWTRTSGCSRHPCRGPRGRPAARACEAAVSEVRRGARRTGPFDPAVMWWRAMFAVGADDVARARRRCAARERVVVGWGGVDGDRVGPGADGADHRSPRWGDDGWRPGSRRASGWAGCATPRRRPAPGNARRSPCGPRSAGSCRSSSCGVPKQVVDDAWTALARLPGRAPKRRPAWWWPPGWCVLRHGGREPAPPERLTNGSGPPSRRRSCSRWVAVVAVPPRRTTVRRSSLCSARPSSAPEPGSRPGGRPLARRPRRGR